nr:hypothetical protein BaRGS_024696 [Batillaria attramentaria]
MSDRLKEAKKRNKINDYFPVTIQDQIDLRVSAALHAMSDTFGRDFASQIVIIERFLGKAEHSCQFKIFRHESFWSFDDKGTAMYSSSQGGSQPTED